MVAVEVLDVHTDPGRDVERHEVGRGVNRTGTPVADGGALGLLERLADLAVEQRAARAAWRVLLEGAHLRPPGLPPVPARGVETVQVERRPVDRPADASAFQERTIEAREYRETPVVHKDARVVEEVDLSKNVESHTETVRDTVRKTEVEIEDERTADRTVDRGITDRDDTFR